jgi:chromosome partitioning protein
MMRKILVINVKGGCGKTTVATNLSSQYAARGYGTTLIDYDPIGSSTRWLAQRTDPFKPIHGIAAYSSPKNMTRAWQMRIPPETQRVIIDTPAGIRGQSLLDYIKDVNSIIIPVLPSALDIHSSADFIRDLLLLAKVRERGIRVLIVANRIRAKTQSMEKLDRFLSALHIPVIARLRDTQNYVHAAEQGCGIHELQSYTTAQDREHWEFLLENLEQEMTAVTQQRAVLAY